MREAMQTPTFIKKAIASLLKFDERGEFANGENVGALTFPDDDGGF
jgi:hypothetical protein